MNSFWRIFSLEIVSAVRSWTFALLAVAAAAWVWLSPLLLKGDGTVHGAREVYIRYGIGGVFALLVVSLVSTATGSIARERAAKRIQLTMVRPVRYMTIAAAKTAAISSIGASVLALSMLLMAVRLGEGPVCSHVLRPLMPSPEEEALAMYEHFMASPETPAQVKKTDKKIVLRLLANRARDNYLSIATNSEAVWSFNLDRELVSPKVRFKFSTSYDQRADVAGKISIAGWSAIVSNMTEMAVTVPLIKSDDASSSDGRMSFFNSGKGALMLRPRCDIELLLPADSFFANTFRAYLELVAVITLVVAFGVFLGSCLMRPVALFTAMTVLAVGEISPSAVEQYPDQLETDKVDRIALSFARFAALATRPVSSLSPLQSLSDNECVEPSEVARVMAIDIFVLPFILCLAASFLMPRKQDET